jgi:hypothetical protein
LAAGIVAALLAGHQALAATFYVAPDGNDTWSGRLSSVNSLRTDGPLASLPGARDAVRRFQTKGPQPEPVRVLIA